MTHPVNGLDETVHQRTRLGIMAVLAESSRTQFTFLLEALSLTDGNLSRHLSTLEKAGMVTIEKGYEGRRPRTWVRITTNGREAFHAELDLLRQLVDRFPSSVAAPDRPQANLGWTPA